MIILSSSLNLFVAVVVAAEAAASTALAESPMLSPCRSLVRSERLLWSWPCNKASWGVSG